MSQFHELTVQQVKRETPQAVSVTLAVPDALKNSFQYISGQYLNFEVTIDGEKVVRSYSLCSSPYTDEALQVAVKEVEGGTASVWFNRKLAEGQTLKVSEPMGNFRLEPNKEAAKHYVLFGGGSGITPLYSIIKTALHEEVQSKVTLFYGNRNGESIIFLEGLQQLADAFPNRFSLVHVLDQPRKKKGLFKSKSLETIDHEEGLMQKRMVLNLLRNYTDQNFKQAEFYLCGPSPMMKEVQAALNDIAIPPNRVHQEYFTEKADEDKVEAKVGEADAEFSGTAQVACTLDGEDFSFSMNETTSVLDAALDNGVDAPFACMVGACTTCKAKLEEGSVHMEDSDALLPSEIEAGYILTCQSHPRSEKIRINYDE